MSLLLLAALATAEPTADYYSASALNHDCANPARIEACFSFVAGVRDTSLAYQQWMKFQEFCLPPSLAIGAMRDTFRHYVEVHARDSDALAASVVLLALHDGYPCKADPIDLGQGKSASTPPPPAATPAHGAPIKPLR